MPDILAEITGITEDWAFVISNWNFLVFFAWSFQGTKFPYTSNEQNLWQELINEHIHIQYSPFLHQIMQLSKQIFLTHYFSGSTYSKFGYEDNINGNISMAEKLTSSK
jgi:hypothetical protein